MPARYHEETVVTACYNRFMSQPTAAAPSGAEHAPELAPVGLRELVLYFLRLGTLGFGGPIALAGYMQRGQEGSGADRDPRGRCRRTGHLALMHPYTPRSSKGIEP